jgi:protein tyrosine phosphatase
MNIEDDFIITFEQLIKVDSPKINECCKIRKLTIKNIFKNEERTLTHYNYLTWPDFGTPDEDNYQVIDDIISNIGKIDNNESDKSKIIIH